tara:strand:- start:839 stop:1903 length:1065 start_codon:yes stop_codon:yes gene_type:complete
MIVFEFLTVSGLFVFSILSILSVVCFFKSSRDSVTCLLGCYCFLYSLLFLKFYWFDFFYLLDKYPLILDICLGWSLAVFLYVMSKQKKRGLGSLKHIFPIVVVGIIGSVNFFFQDLFLIAFEPLGVFYSALLVMIFLSAYVIYFIKSPIRLLCDLLTSRARSFMCFFILGLHFGVPILVLGLFFLSFEIVLLTQIYIYLLVVFLLFDLMIAYVNNFSAQINETNPNDDLYKTYKKSHLSNLNIEKLEADLGYLMNQKRVFKDPLLSLKMLAEMCSVTSHQLSEYLNTVQQTSFSNYLMTFRVEEAKYLLLKYDWRTTLSIGVECGFNSHSSFGRCFKLVTGISPGLFRAEKKDD